MALLVDIVISFISYIPIQWEQITEFTLRPGLFNIVDISESLVKGEVLAHWSASFEEQSPVDKLVELESLYFSF